MAAGERRGTAWAWFAAWLAAGAGFALGVLSLLTIGVFVLPVAALAIVFLATRRTAAVGIAGLISGLGLPILSVAYLNRDGPGDICTTTSGGGSSCTQEWSPWPWLAVGAAVVAFGVIVFMMSARQRARASAPGGSPGR